MEGQIITFREYIKSNILCEIFEIMKEHPYYALLLMSSAFEFLGKCVVYAQYGRWDKIKYKKKAVPKRNTASKKMPNATDTWVTGFLLGNKVHKKTAIHYYDAIRCGLAHALRIKPNAQVSYCGSTTGVTYDHRTAVRYNIDVLDYYSWLRQSCDVILSDNKYAGLLDDVVMTASNYTPRSSKDLLFYEMEYKMILFKKEANKACLGNKSAGRRARTISIELEKLLLQYRRTI